MIENTYGSSNASQPTATHTHTHMLTDNQLCSRMQVSNIYVYVCKSPGCFLLRAHSGIYLVKMTKTNKNGISLTNKMDFYCIRYCFTVFYTIFRTVIVIFIYSYIYLFFISFGLLSILLFVYWFHFILLFCSCPLRCYIDCLLELLLVAAQYLGYQLKYIQTCESICIYVLQGIYVNVWRVAHVMPAQPIPHIHFTIN